MKLKLPSSNPLAKRRPVGSSPVTPATPSPAESAPSWSSTASTEVVARERASPWVSVARRRAPTPKGGQVARTPGTGGGPDRDSQTGTLAGPAVAEPLALRDG